MKSDNWRQISSLFQLALEREPLERGEFLRERCDDDLRREVEELLRSYEADENFLANSPVGMPAGFFAQEDDAPALIGAKIGAYKILQEIDRGGMGIVCLAIRDDDEFRKRVALKLVKRGMDTDEILARFRHERQILASLDHSNIARLLDGGTTDTGLPFFVMEYIEGEPITKYCETQRLSLDERLRLFRKVCAAVSYAHQNLVVHRDLKPSNILVTADGEPKLLDFGIAKLLKPDLFPTIVAPTGLIMRPMTPDYASPEQVRGLPITTASDVYSLGVILYELLTGARPYKFKSQSAAEIERVICKQEPLSPSAAIWDLKKSSSTKKNNQTKQKTNPQSQIPNPKSLRGDLDKILLKALRKESSRRYASVEQLSEDVRRYLEGLPVEACQDNFFYRSSKFVRRNRISVSIAALFVILISSFAVVSYFQARRAERQRVRAEKVSAFMKEIFKISDPNTTNGKTVSAREILDSGAARLENELADEPETKAMLLHTVAEVYESLGLFEQSKQTFEKSLTLRRNVSGNQSEEVALTLEQLGLAQTRTADYSAAKSNYEEALAIWQNLYGDRHERVAALLEKLGRAALERGEWETAVNYFRNSLEVSRFLYGDKYELATCRDSDRGAPCTERTLTYLALCLQKMGDLAEAEKYHRQAVEVARRTNPNDSDMVDHRQHNLADFIAETRGDFAEAERLHQEILDNRLRLYGDKFLAAGFSRSALSVALEANKKYTEAEFNLRETAKIYEGIFGREHPRTLHCLSDLGRFLIYQRKFDEAEKLLREIAARQTKAQHPLMALPTRLFLAVLLSEKGDPAEAEKILREVLPDVKKRYAAPDDHLGLAFLEYGKILLARGEAAQAEPFLRDALENLGKTGSRFKWTAAEAESVLGECLAAIGRTGEAAPFLENGLKGLEKTLGDERGWILKRARRRLARIQ